MIKKIAAILVGAGLVFFIGLRVYDLQQEQSAPKKQKKGFRVISVDLTEVVSGEVREELLLTGALRAKEQVDVVARVTGRLEQAPFQVGDRVQKDELIAALDDEELQQQVRRAEASISVTRANVAQRRAELSNIKANLDRSEQLFSEGLLSPAEHQQQKTSLEVVSAQVQLAEAQQQQSEAELRELGIRLSQTKIYAPMSGIVAARYVDIGALVSPQTPIIRIVNLSTMVSQGNVPERSIGKLRVGAEAVVYVDAMPDQPFTGRVSRIAPVLDAATRSALIEIDITNPQGALKAEMFARIELDLGTMREATLISRDGLVYRGQQPGVYILGEQGDTPIFRPIETGLTRGDQVEVLANLEIGTTIVGRGATMLNEGDRIRVAGPKGSKSAQGTAVPKAEAAVPSGGDASDPAKKPNGSQAAL